MLTLVSNVGLAMLALEAYKKSMITGFQEGSYVDFS